MALNSPRFRSSTQLANASNGLTVNKGANGRSIHLVQAALIDLGFQMPRSTSNPNYSPDGKFGNETADKLMEYQRRKVIPQTGAIDKATITALDNDFRNFKHRVRLHFRSISLTTVPFAQSLSDTETVFGQYGIKMEFGSGMSLGLSPEEEDQFNVVDNECNWIISDGDLGRLHGIGPTAPQNDVLVYYVREFSDPNLLGCGGHAPNRPACTVAANASRWDTAHEACHVLLTSSFNPVHINDTRNLMHPTASSFATTPVLTMAQVNKIRQSPCCTAM
jgi:hypothetical protein